MKPSNDINSGENKFVGIFWIDMDSIKVYAEKVLLKNAIKYGNFLIHPLGHYDLWKKIAIRNFQWAGMEYEDIPRGRLVYKIGDSKPFQIYACPVCNNPGIKSAIVTEFALAPQSYSFDFSDEHYFLDNLRQIHDRTYDRRNLM